MDTEFLVTSLHVCSLFVFVFRMLAHTRTFAYVCPRTPFWLKCERSVYTLSLLEFPGPCGPSEAGESGCFVSGFCPLRSPGRSLAVLSGACPLACPSLLVRQQDLFGRDLLGVTCFVQGIAGALAHAVFPVSFRCPACGLVTSEGYPCWASR